MSGTALLSDVHSDIPKLLLTRFHFHSAFTLFIFGAHIPNQFFTLALHLCCRVMMDQISFPPLSCQELMFHLSLPIVLCTCAHLKIMPERGNKAQRHFSRNVFLQPLEKKVTKLLYWFYRHSTNPRLSGRVISRVVNC